MSKEILFVRGNGQDSDGVDDSLLLDSYDKHFNRVKKKALERMGYSDAQINDVLKPGSKQKKNSINNKKSPRPAPKWSVGARCCSVFSEDGNVYEATITEIHPEKETCRVQYVGYNNEEDVALASLTPSQGRKAREDQALAAAGTDAPHVEGSENCSEEDSGQVNVPRQKGRSPRSNGKQKRAPPAPPMGFNGSMPQFPAPSSMSMPHFNGMPPVMPSVVPPMPFNMMESSAEQTEAFSAMLMSWYMSGYYTGYYEALNARRKQNKK
ncbi:survival motor neuron protein 1 [Bacillus rossius redtenbacheri]|uniref:survival motor neuron protein 1 n=1 Tax=Bacillus rossius redtenbacheri TaxID=93214 RepID=UPI002FDD81EF